MGQRDCEAGPVEHPPESHPLVGVIDPRGLRRLDAGRRRRRCARSRGRRRCEKRERDDEAHRYEIEFSHLTGSEAPDGSALTGGLQ
jgi:hypothetical protein